MKAKHAALVFIGVGLIGVGLAARHFVAQTMKQIDFIITDFNVFKSTNGQIGTVAGNGTFFNTTEEAMMPELFIKITEHGSFGTLPILTHKVLPVETVPANSSEPFEYLATFSLLDNASYDFEFILELDGKEIARQKKNWRNN